MKYRFLIKEDNKRTLEIVPSSYDLIVNNVMKMMKVGLNVQQLSFTDIDELNIKNNNYLTGYTYEIGLYDKLITEYEEITANLGKREMLKKW